MAQGFNTPQVMKDGEQSIKRFVHQPLLVDHGQFKFQIHPNGKVTITGPNKPDPKGKAGDVIYDEITIPASLVFKIKDALFMTRSAKYLTMTEVKNNPEASAPADER